MTRSVSEPLTSHASLVAQRVKNPPAEWVTLGRPIFHSNCEGEMEVARVTVGQNRPHLGWCLGHNVPLQGWHGSRGCIPNSPGESGLVSRDAKDSALLSSRTGYFLDPTEWPKGSQSSCEVWRDFSLAPKSLCMVTAAMKLKDTYSLEGKL